MELPPTFPPSGDPSRPPIRKTQSMASGGTTGSRPPAAAARAVGRRHSIMPAPTPENTPDSALPPSFAPRGEAPRESPSPQTAPRIANYSTPSPQNQLAETRVTPALVAPPPTPATTSPQSGIPAGTPTQGTSELPRKQRPHHPVRRFFLILFALILVLVLTVAFWGIYLTQRIENQLNRVDALSGAPGHTAGGTTWLLAGSDSREGTKGVKSTPGQRSDTIILVHQAPNGQAAIISIPRDSYVEIPGKGANKINASFSWGGAPLLVSTVENLSGLTVDHYVEIGMVGLVDLVDAVGGINVCWDQEVKYDSYAKLSWEPGCHDLDGSTAQAFARMRYSDPQGDIGRTARQRLVIKEILKKSLSKDTVTSPSKQLALADAGSKVLKVDPTMGAFDILRLTLALRQATADNLQGVIPITSMGFNPGNGVGSAVKLDDAALPTFWDAMRAGTLTPAMVEPRK